MRISLNQKPNSSKDFGFQAVWDSTGARVTTIQPGNNRDIWKKNSQTNTFYFKCRALFTGSITSTGQPNWQPTFPVIQRRDEAGISLMWLMMVNTDRIYIMLDLLYFISLLGSCQQVCRSVLVASPDLCRAASIWVRSAGPEPLFLLRLHHLHSISCNLVTFH